MEPSLYLVHISQIMKSKMSARAGKQYLVDMSGNKKYVISYKIECLKGK